MKFLIRVIRVISHEAEIAVEAPSEAEAKFKAIDEAKAICWPYRNSAEYDVLWVKEQDDNKG